MAYVSGIIHIRNLNRDFACIVLLFLILDKYHT
jgi:hypothetical protein